MKKGYYLRYDHAGGVGKRTAWSASALRCGCKVVGGGGCDLRGNPVAAGGKRGRAGIGRAHPQAGRGVRGWGAKGGMRGGGGGRRKVTPGKDGPVGRWKRPGAGDCIAEGGVRGARQN